MRLQWDYTSHYLESVGKQLVKWFEISNTVSNGQEYHPWIVRVADAWSSESKRERARARETRKGWGSACTEGPRKSFQLAFCECGYFQLVKRLPREKGAARGKKTVNQLVHGLRSEGLISHQQLLKALNGIQSKFRSRRSLQSGLMGLCGCNLRPWNNGRSVNGQCPVKIGFVRSNPQMARHFVFL